MEMAKSLPPVSPLTIITDALNVATQAGSRPGVHVVLAGGSLSPETISTVSAAREVVLLADSSKYRGRALARVAPLSAVSQLIIDTGLPDEAAQRLAAAGIEVLRV